MWLSLEHKYLFADWQYNKRKSTQCGKLKDKENTTDRIFCITFRKQPLSTTLGNYSTTSLNSSPPRAVYWPTCPGSAFCVVPRDLPPDTNGEPDAALSDGLDHYATICHPPALQTDDEETAVCAACVGLMGLGFLESSYQYPQSY